MAKYSEKITWGYRPSDEGHYIFQNMERSLTIDDISDNIVQHTNQYILIIQTNFSRETDAEIIEINAFIGILCLAGALQCKKHSLEGMLGY